MLLATTMLHMLPEITHNLEERADQIELECLPQLVVCSGFFLIYLVEELMMSLQGSHHRSDCETLHLESVRRSDCSHDDKQISRFERCSRSRD